MENNKENVPGNSQSDFMEMFRKMVEATSNTVVQNIRSSKIPENVQVSIQNFNPDTDNVEDWVLEVNKAQERFGWNDWETVARSAHHLVGDAKGWYDAWRPVSGDRVWSKLKTDLIQAFPHKRDNGVLLFEAVNYNSNNCKSYDEYARQKLLRLNKVRVNWPEKILIEVIIQGIVDVNVKINVSNQNCISVSALISVLSRYEKQSLNSSIKNQNFRQFKPKNESSLKNTKVCFECGKEGHFKRDCRTLKNDNKTKPPSNAKRPRLLSVCNYCKLDGHTEENCWSKKRMVQNKNEKQINLCTSNKDNRLITVVINNITVNCLPDTGSECSLISEKVVSRLDCHVEPVCVNLKGLGNGGFVSTSQVTLLVQFESFTCEVDFYLVPNNVINVDLLIGNDVFHRPGINLVSNIEGVFIYNKCSMESFSVDIVMRDNILDDIITDLKDTQRYELIELLSGFKENIKEGYCVSPVTTGSLEIKLTTDAVIRYQPYRLSISEREKVRLIIEELLENNIIRESQSPYASPILLVKKKNGSDRMCIDFRALNRITVKDRYPLPLIDDQLDRLGKGKYFTSLDMASGFFQIPIHPDSIEKTAFVTPDGHYEYLRMPFGLANAPAVFQRAINKALGSLIHDGIALVYLDDVLIPSKSVDEGFKRLTKVLNALKNAGFSLNINKCRFLMSKVEYLGREISEDGVRPGLSKINSLIKSPVPKSVREVRQFIGLASYFRKFIPNFAIKMSCITNLTKKCVTFAWTSEHEAVRQQILSILVERPVLSIFNPDLSTELHTDASSLGYGGILFQQDGADRKVIGYFSKRTCDAESRYHSYELETLAIVNALKFFRVYLLGIRFTIITDCNAIKATEKKKDLLPRVARWWIYMQDFTFEVQYRKGSQISHVDYLSRNHFSVNIVQDNKSWIAVQQHHDGEIQELIQKLKDGFLDQTKYLVENDMLFHLDYYEGIPIKQWYVPRSSRLGLLRIFHDEQCHVGFDKTLSSIKKYFWFPGLTKFIRKYLKHCVGCLTLKRTYIPPKGMLHSIPKELKPFHTIHLDYLGPLPLSKDNKQYILTVVDAYSKFTLLYSLESTSGIEFRECFKNFISLFGTPTRLVCDSGSAFIDAVTKNMLRTWQIELHIVTPYVHRGNGQVERYMRTIANMLRVEVKIETDWTKRLWKIQLVINSTIHKTTKVSPLQLLLDCDGTVPVVRSLLNGMTVENVPSSKRHLLRRNRIQKAEEGIRNNFNIQQQYFNKKRKPVQNYEVGDLVLLNRSTLTGKLKSGVSGPFEVLEVLPHDRLKIKRLVGKMVTQCSVDQVRIWPREWVPDDLSDMLHSGSESESESLG